MATESSPRVHAPAKTRLHLTNMLGLKAQLAACARNRLILALFAIVLIGGVLLGYGVLSAAPARWLVAGLLAFIVGLSGYSIWMLRREILLPLSHLREWSHSLRAGNLAIHVPVPHHGELVGLVRDINGLTDELNVLTEEMDSRVRAQIEHIASKSRSLEILYDIATDLSTARNLDELLEQFIDTLMVLVDARAASVRLLTDKGDTVMVASRGLSADVVAQEERVDINRCLCGQVAQEGGLGVQRGIAPCNKFISGSMVAGPCAELVVVPLRYRDRILGVYNLFLERPSAELGKDVRDLLNSIGMHLGLAVEKARLDENERRLAIMEERNFIGNELHDSLAQSLVSMRLQVKMLGEVLHKKDVRAAQTEVQRLREAVEAAHFSLRELMANFRSRMDERGLIPAIQELAERFRQETGIQTYLQNEWPEFAFTPTQEVQIFRIVQEALANVRKHSNASHVRILLGRLDRDHLSVLIEDDGQGTDQAISTTTGHAGESIGLSIMRERANRIDGVLQFESEPGEGTRVQLAFPSQPYSERVRQLARVQS
jgi:two-component system nitrate/nitrite sensor histidine kinase NarX